MFESPESLRVPAPVLVELFALPGAGKSTVAGAAARRANVTTRKGLSLAWTEHSFAKRLSHTVRALSSPLHTAAAVRFAVGARIATPESVWRLVRLLAKTDWLRSQTGVVLLDQGFLQDLWSILVSGRSGRPDPMSLSRLIGALYEDIDATIVVIKVDPQIAAARVEARSNGHSRFDDLPQSEVRRSFESLTELQQRIVEAAMIAGLPVHTLDGSGTPEGQTKELLSLLPVHSLRERAASAAAAPRRISIIGSTGSGKTRLAKLLGKHLDLPVFELDRLRGDAAGRSSGESFEDAVATVTSGQDWIVDGHYRNVRHLIWSRAEMVVWLNYPLAVVGAQLIRRFARKRTHNASPPAASGKNGAELAASSSHQRASWSKRISRLARTLRERREYGRLLRSPEYRALRIVELRSRRMTQNWLENL